MKWKTLVVSVTCMVMCFGCSSRAPWESPSAGLITKNGAALFYIKPQDDAGVVLFHVGDLNSSSSHTSNPKTRTFDYSGTLTAGDAVQVTYRLLSLDAERITINDIIYELSKGRVFLIAEQGSVSQLPFSPLEPSDQYVERLKNHVSAKSKK
jgi:hypothetical protein